MKKSFQAKTKRIKGLCFHPSKPWLITSLHTGMIQIWDYNLKISIAKFQEHQGPVRGVDFHPQLPLFVTGGDDGLVKVWDYKQKRCTFTLRGHIDYIRTTYFHHQLPWILSACDDQTMRIWNYQSRACVNIITGHSHYVMCAQFHHQKNLIVSASLDSTVRIWDFTILKKKLTESKNLSSFIGIQIQCIKVLEGHQRGCNWVCFHPTQNIIASGSDDRKIKLWKYTNEVAWEHSTIGGHKNNVSCVIFDKKTGFLVSNSQDKTTRIWNIQTKAQLICQKRQNDRFWILGFSKNGNLLASGHDNGLQIYEINKQKVPHGMIDQNLVIFAQGMKTFLYDAAKKNQKQQLYQYTPKDKNNTYYINNIIINQFDSSFFIVQIDQNKDKIFMIKRKQSYLNFPYLVKSYQAIDSCFISKTQIAILHSPHQIHMISSNSKQEKKQILKLKQSMNILRIFSSTEEDVLIFVTDSFIAQYDTKQKKILGQQMLQNHSYVRNLVCGYGKIAIVCKNSIVITNSQMEQITKINQKFSIHSAFWQKDELLIYTTKNHWKYALMNGQTGVLRTLQKPIHLLKKLDDSKYLAFSQSQKIFEIGFPSYTEVQFKLAIQQRNWIEAKQIMQKVVGQKKKYLVTYLVSKGLASIALQIVTEPQQKFALAIQATNFQLAFEICNQMNSQEYWKMLGEEALKQGIYQAYQLANQKLKNYDKLSFLYSLQANKVKLEKIQKLSAKMQNPMLSFNVSLFMNNHDQMENLLRASGLQNLAQLSQQAKKNPQDQCDLLRRLGSKPLQIVQPAGELDFSNWVHNVEQEEQN